MAVTFVERDRETPYLLPPLLQDWLPEKHLARFVVEIVEQNVMSTRRKNTKRNARQKSKKPERKQKVRSQNHRSQALLPKIKST